MTSIKTPAYRLAKLLDKMQATEFKCLLLVIGKLLDIEAILVVRIRTLNTDYSLFGRNVEANKLRIVQSRQNGAVNEELAASVIDGNSIW